MIGLRQSNIIFDRDIYDSFELSQKSIRISSIQKRENLSHNHNHSAKSSRINSECIWQSLSSLSCLDLPLQFPVGGLPIAWSLRLELVSFLCALLGRPVRLPPLKRLVAVQNTRLVLHPDLLQFAFLDLYRTRSRLGKIPVPKLNTSNLPVSVRSFHLRQLSLGNKLFECVS